MHASSFTVCHATAGWRTTDKRCICSPCQFLVVHEKSKGNDSLKVNSGGGDVPREGGDLSRVLSLEPYPAPIIRRPERMLHHGSHRRFGISQLVVDPQSSSPTQYLHYSTRIQEYAAARRLKRKRKKTDKPRRGMGEEDCETPIKKQVECFYFCLLYHGEPRPAEQALRDDGPPVCLHRHDQGQRPRERRHSYAAGGLRSAIAPTLSSFPRFFFRAV